MLDKFNYTKTEVDKILKTVGILVDSREKVNGDILDMFDKKKIPYKKHKLDYGDYSYYLPANEEYDIPRDLHFDKEIVFERKGSIDEISGNFAKDRDRIEKEFSLCPATIHLLIEGSYKDMVEGNYRSTYGAKACVATLHSFADRYDLHLFFNPDKELSAQIMYYTFYYHLRNILK